MKTVKAEPDVVGRSKEVRRHKKPVLGNLKKSKAHHGQESEDNRSSSAVSTGQSGTSALDQEQSQFDDTSPCLTSSISSAPLCRQFWKAGKYDDGVAPKSSIQSTHLSMIILLFVICSDDINVFFFPYVNFTCGYVYVNMLDNLIGG